MNVGEHRRRICLTYCICKCKEISIGNLVVESLNRSFERGELSPSQKRSIITLLAKSGSDRQLLKNWRPISLLNIDYKIASNVLANRMKTVLPTIIHQDQVGYLKGRQIADAVRAIADTIIIQISRIIQDYFCFSTFVKHSTRSISNTF